MVSGTQSTTTTSATKTSSTTAAKAASATTQHDQFMKLLMTELTHQDPMEPMKGAEMTQQMLVLEQLSTTANLETQIKQMNQSVVINSAQLIGKKVEVRDPNGTSQVFTGTVDSVRSSGGKLQVSVNGKNYPIELINSVSNAV